MLLIICIVLLCEDCITDNLIYYAVPKVRIYHVLRFYI